MMVTFVRGHFKDIHGTLVFDPADPGATSVEATIEASGIWTGEADRDAHLKSADFLDAEKHPQITFAGSRSNWPARTKRFSRRVDDSRHNAHGAAARALPGQWQTPWWEDGVDKGPKTRAGFAATATINRHDFGVSWNSTRTGVASSSATWLRSRSTLKRSSKKDDCAQLLRTRSLPGSINNSAPTSSSSQQRASDSDVSEALRITHDY